MHLRRICTVLWICGVFSLHHIITIAQCTSLNILSPSTEFLNIYAVAFKLAKENSYTQKYFYTMLYNIFVLNFTGVIYFIEWFPFILPRTPREHLLGYWNLGWHSFYVNTWKMSSHCLLASTVSDERSAYSDSFKYDEILLLSSAFKNCCSSNILNILYMGRSILCLSNLYLIKLLEYVDFIFSVTFRKFSSTIFQVSSMPLSLLFLSPCCAHADTIDGAPQLFKVLFIVLYFHSFYSSDLKISMGLY